MEDILDSERKGYGYCIKCWINAGALCTPCFMKERIADSEKADLDKADSEKADPKTDERK
jgi:hypothetical protein